MADGPFDPETGELIPCAPELDGVAIPFASPELLWRMKCRANREKDRGDIQFLRMWFAAQGRTPPEV